MTDLTPGRISQWRSENHIPDHWMKFFKAARPDLFDGDRLRAAKKMPVGEGA